MNFVKYFEYAKKIGFSDVEFKVQTSNKLSISVFQKKVENYSVSENETIYIRGIFNGKMVSGSSENVNNICKILDEMAVNATLIEEEKEQEIFAGSDLPPRPRRKWAEKSWKDSPARRAALAARFPRQLR